MGHPPPAPTCTPVRIGARDLHAAGDLREPKAGFEGKGEALLGKSERSVERNIIRPARASEMRAAPPVLRKPSRLPGAPAGILGPIRQCLQ